MTKTISVKERFAIGFTSSMFLPFIKLYQNGSLLEASELKYYIGLLLPFVLLGVVMGIYAWAVEKDETNSKRLFRTCFAMPGALLSILGTQGAPTGMAKASAPIEMVCEDRHEAIQGLIDTFDAITNHHRPRYFILSTTETKAKDYLVVDGKKYWVLGETATKPSKTGVYFDIRNCKILTRG